MKKVQKLKLLITSLLISIMIISGCFIFNSNATEKNETNTSNSNSSKSNTAKTEETEANKDASNANLSNLGIRPHDFTGFKYGTTKYEVKVPSDTESVEVYAEAQNNKAKVSGTGTMKLEYGENIAEVKVTAEDGTTKTYTITIIRQTEEEQETNSEKEETGTEVPEEKGEGLASLNIQNVEMTPKFETNVYEYTAKYIGEKTSLPIEVEPTNKGYTVEIVGNENLKEGENIITVLVSENNGDNIATYQITVQKSLVDEEAIAREKAEKEARQKKIIGAIVAVVIIISIIIFIIIRKRRNRAYAEEYSVPYYGMNRDDDEYYDDNDYEEDDEEELPRAFGRRKNRYTYEEQYEIDKETDKIPSRKMSTENDEKTEKDLLREKFLEGYNKSFDDYDDYEETPRKKHKGKRFK